MNQNITYRKATTHNLKAIVNLLLEDELGQTREHASADLDPRYIKAFDDINSDPNQYLMIAEIGQEIVGTCHLTIMPSLTYIGQTRMQIEAVRISEKYRGKGVGRHMMNAAFDYAKSREVGIIQLTTNKNVHVLSSSMKALGLRLAMRG